ncbi:MAG TPA: transglycosylase family protein [Streptomyces sp.]|nr:transglycosylase family protein [Streptomyces sp.]
MLSANGRHRRPRQAPALVVAVGVAGSAIAIPLLGASSAGAAESATWDRVAECESGGMWSADLGNGYYGGLQFSQETWKDFGGTAYAPRADLASRSQQIQIAEKVFADQGPQAWPSCSVISGLATDPGDGATAEPTPSETADSTGSDGSAAAEKPSKPKTADSAKSADTPKSADPTTSPASKAPAGSPEEPAGESTPPATPTAEEGTPQGKHRGGKAEEPRESAGASTGDAGESRESGRHASRGEGSARDAKDAAGAADGEYVVQAGDSLWAIADAHDVSGGWSAIYQANETVVGSDADLIRPGQSLDLTAK